MNKLSFKNRIRFGFFIVIIILLGTTSYAIWQLQTISQKMQLVYGYSYKVSTSIRDAQIEINKAARMLRNVELIHDNTELDLLIDDENISDSLINSYLTIVKNQYLGNKSDIDNVMKEFSTWKMIRDRIIRLKRENQLDSLERIINSEDNRQVSEIINKTKIISDSASKRAEDAMLLIIEKKEKTLNILLFVMLTATIIVFLLSYFISKSISQPIIKFVKQANTIFTTQSEKTEVEFQSEEELFEYSLNELRLSYQNIEHQNEEIRTTNEQLDKLNQTLNEKFMQSELLLKKAIELAPYPIMIHCNGEIIQISSVWTEITGYSIEEIPTIEAWSEKAYGKEALPSKEFFYKLYDIEKKQYDGEWVIRLKDGKTRIWEFSSSPLGTLPNGQKAVISMAIDITDRKQAEKALKHTSTRLKLATSVAGVGIWNYDIVNNILTWDNQMYSLYGIEKENFGGAYDAWLKGVHPDDKLRSNQEIQLAIKGEKEFNTEFRVVWADGSIHYIRAIAIVLRGKSGEALHMIGTNWDITEQKSKEQTITQQNKELKKLNSDKDRFMSILAHDLKSPFISILGFLELLTQNIRKYDIDKIEKQIYIINDSAHNAYTLLDELLIWIQAQTGRIPFYPQEFSFHKACSEVIALLKPTAQIKKIEIQHTADETIMLYADIEMFKTIMRNLISNAIKFTNLGGIITVDALQDETHFTVIVADNGVGMTQNEIEKLFDVSRTRSTLGTAMEKGTGLGLLLCKEFVEKHNGMIWVESDLGKGSKFKFTLESKQM